jgi:hypothetical protein
VGKQEADAALNHSDSEVSFELFVVDCGTLRDDLYQKSKHIATSLLFQIMEVTTEKNWALRRQYEEMDSVLNGYQLLKPWLQQ